MWYGTSLRATHDIPVCPDYIQLEAQILHNFSRAICQKFHWNSKSCMWLSLLLWIKYEPEYPGLISGLYQFSMLLPLGPTCFAAEGPTLSRWRVCSTASCILVPGGPCPLWLLANGVLINILLLALWKGKKPWSLAFANFHGVNNPTANW